MTAPTGQKPQSKLWYADGRWWGVLWDPALNQFAIHGFNLETQATNAWTSTGVAVDARPHSQADVLWDNGARKLYVITHLKAGGSSADQGLKFLRFGYAAGVFVQEASHTVVNGSVEAAVMDKDSTGRLWVTYTQSVSGGRRVMVAHSTTSDTTWTTPFALPVSSTANTVGSDDISTLVAYRDGGGRKIGVMWSNQQASALYFASHVDGAPDSEWSLTALCQESLCPDDHLNVKSIDADASGHLYAAVKTSLNDKATPVASDPLIVVYRLNPSGGWSSSTAWTVGDGDFTRPIVALDSQNRRVHTFSPGSTSGGTVYTKSTGFDSMTFPSGKGTAFIRGSGENINNPTTTKQTVNNSTGLLVLASADSTRSYVHNYMPLGGGSLPGDTTPPSVTGVSPVEGATGVPVSTDVSATFSEPMDASTVTGASVTLRDGLGLPVAASVSYDATAARVTLNPTVDLAPGATYTATVHGGAIGVKDSAGNALAEDKVWSFTTASSVVSALSFGPTADAWVDRSNPLVNHGSDTRLQTDGSPDYDTLLRFDVAGTGAGTACPTVERAELTVTVGSSANDNSVRGSDFYATTGSDWDESTVTWDNAPATSGTAVASMTTAVSAGTSYTVDVTPLVSGDGPVSIRMTTPSSDAARYFSKEGSTTKAPVLVVSCGSPAAP